MIGPKNLLDLNTPEIVWANTGILVALATGTKGGYFELVVNRYSAYTVADIITALQQLPQHSLLRDAFADDEDITINF
ncbi:hypothetical protein SAMN05216276_1008182 [Streptosporangium subroseum]|uniref:Uncharacterized protein n=1 Tax=Streptosporangium subroseum TaxID=106412 RepID=A0A239E1T6_9ACTN|nr:hypothetical protein [Streptosporangium subroseum]SNS38656.1 hypothetical protein SAMN05216276_1008182 [Streptosporangium subroseum]